MLIYEKYYAKYCYEYEQCYVDKFVKPNIKNLSPIHMGLCL